jgi:DNA-directed RNA polymerase subunit RPC12/RpoP
VHYSAKCPNCVSSFEVSAEGLAEKIVCPECGHRFGFKPPAKRGSAAPPPVATEKKVAAAAPPPKPAALVGEPNPSTPAAATKARAPMPSAVKPRQPAASPPPLPQPAPDTGEGTLIGHMEPMLAPPPSTRKTGRPPIGQRSRTATVPSRPMTVQSGSLFQNLTSNPKNLAYGLLGLLLLAGVGLGSYFIFRGKSENNGAEPERSPQANLIARFGGIEIGSKGVKMIAIELYKTPDGVEYSIPQIKNPNSVNTNIATLKKGAEDFDPDKLEQTIEAVKDYYKSLRNEQAVPDENIYVVCGSGVFSKFGKNDAARTRNQDKLAAGIKAKTKKTMALMDAIDEARNNVVTICPKGERDHSYLLDVGSGNTKGGGFVNEAFVKISLDLGTTTYSSLIKSKQMNETFVAAAHRLNVDYVNNPIDEKLADIRVLTQRRKIQLAGGIVWAMATCIHPDKQLERRSKLSALDIEAFQHKVETQDFNSISKEAINEAKATNDNAIVQQVQKDLEAISATFSQEDLIAGANILAAFSKRFQLGEKQIEFFRLSHFGWLLHYILDQSGQWK